MEQQKSLQSGVPIEITIGCRNLANLNNVYLSDPQVFLYEVHGTSKKLLGHTEISKHNLNPDFKTNIKAIYHFNKQQTILFQIIDTNESILGKVTEMALSGDNKENFIGEATKTLAELMGAPNCLSKFGIKKENKPQGLMIVAVDFQKDKSEDTMIQWQWGAYKLKDVDWLSKSDPFVKFYKYHSDTDKLLVHQSERIDDNLNPTWKPWSTSKQELCPKQDKFLAQVWDYESIGGHNFIGQCDISLTDLLENEKLSYILKTKNNKDAGHLNVVELKVDYPPPPKKDITILDYLRGQWQLSLVAGIDYTFSNLPITKEDSLHRGQDNQYIKCLKNVAGIIIAYDQDKKVPLYGFGGIPKLPTYTKGYAENCFPLNGDPKNPECQDVSGLIKAYLDATPNVEFSGPTFVGEILQHSIDQGKKNAEKNIYTVVLIMTDGQIEDMDDALELIGKCSELPMSILILGIGDEDFTYMKILDDIEQIKKKSKNPDKMRDITQFVALKDFKFDVEKLAEKIFDVIPVQFMDYMKLNDIKPEEVKKVNISEVEKQLEQ